MSGIRDEVAAAARRLAAAGLVLGTAGNVSARQGDRVAITASGVRLADANADDVTIVDLSGRVLDGALRPSSETPMHLGVYSTTDAAAVVHTHSGAAVSLSLVTDELPVIHYQQLLLGGAMHVVPFATFGSIELADGVTAALSDHTAAVLAHHGAVTRGATLDAAFDALELLEWLCRTYLDAAAVATPRSLSQAQIDDVIARAVATGYGDTHPVDG